MPKKIIFDYDEIYQLYVIEKKSIAKTAKILNVDRLTMSKYINNSGMKEDIQHRSERISVHENIGVSKEQLKNDIYKYYIIQNKTIAELCGIYSVTRYKMKSLLSEFGIVKIKNLTNDDKKYDNYDLLKMLYVDENRSIPLIAHICECDDDTITRKLKEFDLWKPHHKGTNFQRRFSNPKSRTLLLARKKFNTRLRKQRLKIDNYCCIMCGSIHELHVHHVISLNKISEPIFEKYNCLDLEKEENRKIIADEIQQLKIYNDLNNLMTLCSKCHYEIHRNSKV